MIAPQIAGAPGLVEVFRHALVDRHWVQVGINDQFGFGHNLPLGHSPSLNYNIRSAETHSFYIIMLDAASTTPASSTTAQQRASGATARASAS